jgi:hypothetical protein
VRTERWRRLHDEELHNLHASSIGAIKSKRMRWVGHAEWMEEMKNTKFWLENLKGRDRFEDLCIDGRIILEWILGQ